MSQEIITEQRSVSDRRDAEFDLLPVGISFERRVAPERRFPAVEIFEVEDHIEVYPAGVRTLKNSV